MTYEKDTKVCVSIKTLYENLKSEELKYGKIVIDCDSDGDDYYDLYNESGQLACMDGETCTVVRIEFGNVVLKNEGGDRAVYFRLTMDEAATAIFIIN